MMMIFHIFVLLITHSLESKNFNAPKANESFLCGLGYQPFVVGAIFDMKTGIGKWKRTEAHNKAKSESYKKKGIKPPSRKGKTPWNKGKTGCYSEETRKSISKSVSKYLKENPLKLNEDARRKIGEAHKGEKSTFWKGGVSKKNRTERENIMTSFEYQSWRRKIFERDDYTCQMEGCGKRGGKIRAHHIKKFALYPDLRFDLRNGVVICEGCDCKKVVHREEKWEKYFFSNLTQRGIISDKEMLLLNEL